MVAMTDFYSVLQRAVQSLPDGSGPQRRQVYEKARKALIKQLQSFDPPLSSADVTAQRLALEDAIRKIENEIARQNRTRRAVQGALPAGARAGEAAERESEAEREARRRAEAERTRAERAEVLRSAVSDAMLSPDAEVAAEPAPTPTSRGGPQPAQLPAPMELSQEPIETAEAEVVGDDFLEEEYDQPLPVVPARRRGQRPDPALEPEHIDEAEYEAVEEPEEIDAYDDDDEDELDPKEAKRRRREEERQLARRASRLAQQPQGEEEPQGAGRAGYGGRRQRAAAPVHGRARSHVAGGTRPAGRRVLRGRHTA